jgi:hypothetical protein
MNGTPNQTEPNEAAGHAQPSPQPQSAAPSPFQRPVGVSQRDPRFKSPAMACILSAVPGLGQVYVGYYARGFVHAIVVFLLFSMLVGGDPAGGEKIMILLLMFMCFFWLYNIIDAGRRAVLFNEALAGNESIELPQDLKLPSLGGSIAGGVLFIVAGVILLTYTRFDMSLRWLEEWWPAFGIAFGAYLLIKGIYERVSGGGV